MTFGSRKFVARGIAPAAIIAEHVPAEPPSPPATGVITALPLEDPLAVPNEPLELPAEGPPPPVVAPPVPLPLPLLLPVLEPGVLELPLDALVPPPSSEPENGAEALSEQALVSTRQTPSAPRLTHET